MPSIYMFCTVQSSPLTSTRFAPAGQSGAWKTSKPSSTMSSAFSRKPVAPVPGVSASMIGRPLPVSMPRRVSPALSILTIP
ncbi:MAG: hypothetical protein A4E28_00233 [Methanocella sp. PtaU1.Bin125]|nr:MAG: hypothetical protein A4E28_00233 [Methanocella sp. PtaU1.Bin125]